MSKIIRGKKDKYVRQIKEAVDEYELVHPGSVGTLYRQNSAAVRVRIVDERFRKMPKAERHDQVFNFLADKLNEDTLQEISVLVLLAPNEQGASLMNLEFNDPLPSQL